MTNQNQKEITFDSIRGKGVTEPLSNFNKFNCYGHSKSFAAVYHEWNVKRPPHIPDYNYNRYYFSDSIPCFYYLMDSIGQRWIIYTIDSIKVDKLYNKIGVLIPSNRKTEKDLANNRVFPYDLFFRPGSFLVEMNMLTYEIEKLKIIEGNNLPKKLLPPAGKTVADIGWDEILHFDELVSLNTKDLLTYDYIGSYNTRYQEYIRISNPKVNGIHVGFAGNYYLQKNELSLGWDNYTGKYHVVNF